MKKHFQLTERGRANIRHVTREAWLRAMSRELAPVFKENGAPLPAKIRLAIGFPSHGSRGSRIGECWDSSASKDGAFEILIRPDFDDADEITAILAHELIHAAVGIDAGHGKAFKRVADALGLVGPMKATTAGPAFAKLVAPMLKRVGAFPHASLNFTAGKTTRPKKQKARQLKCQCTRCGYTVRVAKKWLEQAGAPFCPSIDELTGEAHGQMAGALDEPADDEDREDA